jgi:3-oxoadipate enol-lactonase
MRGTARAGQALGIVARRLVKIPPVGEIPPGRLVHLPGRGTTFVVDVPGPKGAPTLLLLHALACTAYLSWYPVMAELSQQYRLVSFDQRWHGRGIRSPRFRL